MVCERIKDFPNQIIGIAHADDLKVALMIKEMLIERLDITMYSLKNWQRTGCSSGHRWVGVFFSIKGLILM